MTAVELREERAVKTRARCVREGLSVMRVRLAHVAAASKTENESRGESPACVSAWKQWLEAESSGLVVAYSSFCSAFGCDCDCGGHTIACSVSTPLCENSAICSGCRLEMLLPLRTRNEAASAELGG